jgi:alkylated DNA repair dioxygenase AlkB
MKICVGIDAAKVTHWAVAVDGEGRVVLDRAVEMDGLRHRLARDGIVELAGFVTDTALEALRAEARAVADRAYFCAHRHNVYLTEDDPALPEDHPRNRKVVTDKGNVAMDRIPADGPLRRLYDWAPLRDFVARVQGVPILYPYGDSLAALMINVNRPGETLGWHYDNSDFAVTLMIDPGAPGVDGEVGGGFQYVSGSRTGDAAETEIVAAVLEDRHPAVIETRPAPGTLTIFRGRESLHRVTAPTGDRARLVGVLSYAEAPDIRMSAYTQELFHGRTAP